jgi:long-chain fatty acid transport protein
MKRILALVVLLLPATAHAGGFYLGEEGAAATGMTGAFTAKADDPSTIFYNPAGLAKQHGLQLYVGTSLYLGQAHATNLPLGGSEDMNYLIQPVPTIYAAYGLPHNIGLGVGAFTAWGLSVEWPTGWQGRFVSTQALLNTVTINPTASWQPVDWFAIGGGVDITPAAAEFARQLDLFSAVGRAHFRGNAWGVGGNAGVLFKTPKDLTDRTVSVGVSYRSRYDLNFDDGALRVDAPPELSGMLHDAKATATVPVPDTISSGVGMQVMSRLFMQAQVDWVNWSRFQTLALSVPSDPIMNLSVPQNWHDGWVLRTGGQYDFEKLSVRGGIGYDWNPIPDQTLSPLLPDANRWLVSGGASLNMWNMIGEIGLLGVIFEGRSSANPMLPVHFSNYAIVTSLSLSYRQH